MRLQNTIGIINNTIARLTAQVTAYRNGDSHGVTLPGDIETAAADSLTIDLEIHKRFYELLRPHIVDLVTVLQEDTATQLKEMTTTIASVYNWNNSVNKHTRVVLIL